MPALQPVITRSHYGEMSLCVRQLTADVLELDVYIRKLPVPDVIAAIRITRRLRMDRGRLRAAPVDLIDSLAGRTGISEVMKHLAEF